LLVTLAAHLPAEHLPAEFTP
nr:hemoglobin alpha-chain=Hb Zaire [human, Peptide Partial Mutant, 20 aa] [Homo sapiens]